MKLRHRSAAFAAFILLLAGAAGRAQTKKPVPMKAVADPDSLANLPECVPSAPSGYPGRQCVVTIYRDAPVSPPALLVPPGTDVFVKVLNTRKNEAVLFTVATTRTTPPDVAGAAVKNLISPLQTLVFTQRTQALDGGDKIVTEQSAVADTLNSIQDQIRNAATLLTCLSNYQVAHQTEEGAYTCSQADLIVTRATFDNQKKQATDLANKAAHHHLPLDEIDDIEPDIAEATKDCLAAAAKAPATEQDAQKKPCRAADDRYKSNQARLKSGVSDIQKAQSALMVSVDTLEAWLKASKNAPDAIAYQFKSSKLINMVVTITGQEVVNKTSSPIATVTINTQNTNWVISTGILFSNLKFHTFSNAPIIVNGKPVLDASGKVTTVVTRSDTSPSVVAPELLVSYRLPWISRFTWENRCPGGCSFLVSGGVGANLTSKTADFDSGFSFQFGSLLLTPTVHYGRDNRLTNGLTVGQQLGASPPTLPTENHWVKKFGIAVTYALPIP